MSIISPDEIIFFFGRALSLEEVSLSPITAVNGDSIVGLNDEIELTLDMSQCSGRIVTVEEVEGIDADGGRITLCSAETTEKCVSLSVSLVLDDIDSFLDTVTLEELEADCTLIISSTADTSDGVFSDMKEISLIEEFGIIQAPRELELSVPSFVTNISPNEEIQFLAKNSFLLNVNTAEGDCGSFTLTSTSPDFGDFNFCELSPCSNVAATVTAETANLLINELVVDFKERRCKLILSALDSIAGKNEVKVINVRLILDQYYDPTNYYDDDSDDGPKFNRAQKFGIAFGVIAGIGYLCYGFVHMFQCESD